MNKCRHTSKSGFINSQFRTCAMNITTIYWTADMPISIIETTLRYCFEFKDIQFRNIIINKIYLDLASNARFISIIEQIKKDTESCHIMAKFYFILPLHERFTTDLTLQTTFNWSITIFDFFSNLFKMFQENRSLFDASMPLFQTQITTNCFRWYNKVIEYFVSGTSVKKSIGRSINFILYPTSFV